MPKHVVVVKGSTLNVILTLALSCFYKSTLRKLHAMNNFKSGTAVKRLRSKLCYKKISYRVEVKINSCDGNFFPIR